MIQTEFKDVWTSIAKVAIMTTGEFEYGGIVFGTEENPDDPVHEVCNVSTISSLPLLA